MISNSLYKCSDEELSDKLNKLKQKMFKEAKEFEEDAEFFYNIGRSSLQDYVNISDTSNNSRISIFADELIENEKFIEARLEELKQIHLW